MLLFVWWARSYWWYDEATVPLTSNSDLLATSERGRIHFFAVEQRASLWWRWYSHYSADAPQSPGDTNKAFPRWRWLSYQRSGRPEAAVSFPLWFPAIVCFTLAAMLWFQWPRRFTLRAMFIATTLVALVLGVVALLLR